MKGILKGYDGLMNEEIIDMTARYVSDTIERGGTILYTARCAEATPEGQKRAADVCRKHGIDGLVIGGDGSFAGAQKLELLISTEAYRNDRPGYRLHRIYHRF